MTGPIRILLADDHPIVRRGLEQVLSLQPDMVLVGQASDGQEAVLRALEQRPDVVVMDLKMPVKDGLTAIAEISRELLDTRILVLTSFDDDERVFGAIKMGALGFVLKDSAAADLLDAIRAVYRGDSALHPTIARKVLQEIKQPSARPIIPEPLTARELEVLQRLAHGLSNREIALDLDVSIRTVTTHVRNILDKLHLANRTLAALYARDQGLSDVGPAS